MFSIQSWRTPSKPNEALAQPSQKPIKRTDLRDNTDTFQHVDSSPQAKPPKFWQKIFHRRMKEPSNAPTEPQQPQLEQPQKSWLDQIDKLPPNSRARESFHRIVLFDLLRDFEDGNPYRVNPEKAIDAYCVLKDALRSDFLKDILNKPDTHGNYPLDYAAAANRPFIMKMLVDQGAHKIKSWESWEILKRPGFSDADIQAFKSKKAELHQNTMFGHFLSLVKQNPKLGEIQDKQGNTLLHYLLQVNLPEALWELPSTASANRIARTEQQNADWQKTLTAIVNTGLRLNIKNNKGESPLGLLSGKESLFPQTIATLKKAGAKISPLPRPNWIID